MAQCEKNRPQWLTDFNRLFGVYIRAAKDRGVRWQLSKRQFKLLTRQNCYICGQKPHQIYRHRKNSSGYKYNGVDRLDNNKGYSLVNVKPCCKYCNRMKSNLTLKDFKTHILKIAKVLL